MKCNLCNSNKLKKIILFGKKPIVHHLKNLKNDKQSSYNFDIAKCDLCGHLQIFQNIKPELLYQNYLTPSAWKNNWHLNLLIEKLISIFNLSKKNQILEVGSNDGFFIQEFKKRGYKNIYGIEPSKDVFLKSKKLGHKVINYFFTEEIVKKEFKLKKKFDLIYSRQVLEHIPDLNNFINEISKALSANGYLMIEVPDHDMNYENFDYSFWEEHVNYFNLKTLELLLAKNNFRIIHSETTLYSGKAIIVFAEKFKFNKIFKYENKNKIKINNYQKGIKKFRNELVKFLKKFNKEIYIYGCGNRSCNFVNLLNLSKYIKGYIDDNKNKQNKFVPGSNLKIFPSNKINYNKSVILLGVNCENEHKVINKIKNKSQIFSILPPSKYLPDFWKKMIELNRFM